MNIIQNDKDWELVKYKLVRKFNHLQPSEFSDIRNEEEFINYLEKRLCKTKPYVEFMLKKMVYYNNSNRL